MTCIIAHRLGWMVADRRVTFGENFIGPYQRDKIRRGTATLLVGIAGRAIVGDLVTEALGRRNPNAAIDDFARVMREHGRGCNALALTTKAIVEYDQSGAAFTLTADWWAIGSGWQAALGWLEAVSLGRKNRLITVEDAQHAITFASRLNSDIGDGFQVERL
jgi:hypothetical protein